MKTLIIEDDPITCERFATLAAKRGHEVTTVADSETAMPLCQSNQFDLIILDVVLPGVDGLEFCRRLRAQPGGERPFVMVITAYVFPEDLGRVLKAGADDYLQKPEDSGVLQVRLSIAENLAYDRIKRYRAEAFGRTILENALDGFWILNLKGDFTEVNKAFCQITGYSREEVLKMNIRDLDLRDSEDSFSARIDQLVKLGSGSFEIKQRRKDGRILDLELAARFLPVDGGILCGFTRDVTRRKEVEREREIFGRKIEQAQRFESLGVMSSGIAHDFNNILAGILGCASLARLSASGNNQLADTLAKIESLSLRAADLCKQMMAYAGKIRPTLRPIPVNQFVEETILNWRKTLDKKCGVELQLAPNVTEIMGDSDHLGQALHALMLNATEASEPMDGIIGISTSLRHAVPADFAAAHMSPDLPEGQYVVIEISDNGCGIDPSLKEKIFDPFFSTKFAGRGLGLAALAGIVRAHEGAVSVESKPGRGANFRIWLPASKRGEPIGKNESAGGSSDSIGSLQSTEPKRALVADDEEALLSVVSRILQSMGYKVETAKDGLAAVETFCASKTPFDLVILDLTMPRLDGSRACEQIRAIDKQVRIVLMSGYAEDMAQLKSAGGGFDAFLAKPFTLATFREVVERQRTRTANR